jgi:chromosome segregation ATPase
MVASKTANDLMFERLADGLDSTSKLTHALLTEIRDSEADFASIKTELAILRENVKGLSTIIREGNGATSLLTKIALIEQKLETIDKWVDSHVDVHQRVKGEISKLKDFIDELEDRIQSIEKEIELLKEKERERLDKLRRDEEERQSYIDLENKLDHEKKKSAITLREERQKTVIKVLATVILGLISLGVWYLTK